MSRIRTPEKLEDAPPVDTAKPYTPAVPRLLASMAVPLPPQPAESAPPSSPATARRKNLRSTKTIKLPPNSKIRVAALRIIALKIEGKTHKEIAQELGLSYETIKTYLYLAGRQGWFDPDIPQEQLEYKISHKIVRNLDQMLDSEDAGVKERVTLKAAEGTLFKKFTESAAPAASMNVLSIKVELPQGASTAPALRPETSGGLPRFIEGEVHETDSEPQPA